MKFFLLCLLPLAIVGCGDGSGTSNLTTIGDNQVSTCDDECRFFTTRRVCTTDNCTGSGASEGLDWVLKANATYVDLTKTQTYFTTNSAKIFREPAFEGNESLAGGYAWTGLAMDAGDGFTGGKWSNSENCANWTDQNNPGGTVANDMVGSGSVTYSHFSFFPIRLYANARY